MTIGALLSIIFFGLVLYYLLFREPSSDMICPPSHEDDIKEIQKYLTANGIKTYVKNEDVRRLARGSDLANPSLHVVNADDFKKAIELLRSHEQFKENLRKRHRQQNLRR